jgi:hypothetical protein
MARAMTSIVPPVSVRKGREIHAMLETGRQAAEEVAQDIEAIKAAGFTVTSTNPYWSRAERRNSALPTDVTRIAAPSLKQLRLYAERSEAERKRRST